MHTVRWWRAARPVPLTGEIAFVAPGISRADAERTVGRLGGRPDDHWRYRLTSVQLGVVADPRSGVLATVTIDLRGAGDGVEVRGTCREGLATTWYLGVNVWLVGALIVYASAVQLARVGAGSPSGWLGMAAGVAIWGVALLLGRVRARIFTATSTRLDASLRTVFGAPVPVDPPPAAPVSRMSARTPRTVGTGLAVAAVVLGVVRTGLAVGDHARAPHSAPVGTTWDHTGLENQLKVFDGAGPGVVCNEAHDFRATSPGQTLTCVDPDRGTYLLTVSDAADERYSVLLRPVS